MPTLPDLLYVAWFAVLGPAIDYWAFWPAFRRRSEADPARARTWLCAWTIVSSWALVAVGAALWASRDRSWTSFGFTVPDGWRLWTSIGVFLLVVAYQALAVSTVARSSDARASLRDQSGEFSAVLPHTRTEMLWFGGLSLTAGFCEEFLYRGYFLWFFSPLLGWWGAAALSLPVFAGWHAYQGWNGVLRTGVTGGLYTLLIAVSGALWPAIAVHTIMDLGGGMMAWLALREGSDPRPLGSTVRPGFLRGR
jgi:membrane protease YdiL (CAAX protease family)